MASLGLLLHLWNFARPGVDLLERTGGEIGLDHVCVPVITGPQRQTLLCGLEEQQAPAFATEGGWHFPPQAQRYVVSGVKPRPARWMGGRDALGEFVERAAKLRVRVLLRLDVGALAQSLDYPHLLETDAWGSTALAQRWCPLNASVRELVRQALADVQRYGPAGAQLANWSPPTDGDRLEALLARCFCAACRQIATSAGVDPDAAARSVRAHVARLSLDAIAPNAEVRQTVLGGAARDELLARYDAALHDDQLRWLRHIATSVTFERRFLLGVGGAATLRDDGSDSPWQLLHRAEPGAITAGTRALTLPVWRPEIPNADALVKAAHQAVQAGAEYIEFAGLEEAPAYVRTWLRQAVRFARREAIA